MTAEERIAKRFRKAEDLAAELAKLEAEIKASKARKNGKAGIAPGKSRNERRNGGKEQMQSVRALVMQRAAEKCEVCGRAGMVLELDHLASGSVRRHSVDACLAVCADCHRWKHRNDRPMLRAYVETCLRIGLRAGHAEMTRRLAKVEASRAAGGDPMTCKHDGDVLSTSTGGFICAKCRCPFPTAPSDATRNHDEEN